MTHICISKLTTIVSDNGLLPGRRQAIIWTNAWILLTGLLGTNSSEMLIKIQPFSLKKMHLKMSFAKCCPFRLGLNELTDPWTSRPVVCVMCNYYVLCVIHVISASDKWPWCQVAMSEGRKMMFGGLVWVTVFLEFHVVISVYNLKLWLCRMLMHSVKKGVNI